MYLYECSSKKTTTFNPLTSLLSERTSPELLYIQAKWLSLVSYGMTVKAFKGFLPVDEKLNASMVRNKTLDIAKRCGTELGDEQVFFIFINGCPVEWESLPPPDEAIIVGIDGGYVKKGKSVRSILK